jgi:hypothetical protein
MNNFDSQLKLRQNIYQTLIDILNHNSVVKHDLAGYVLSRQNFQRFCWIYDTLTQGVDSVNKEYFLNTFAKGKLDSRYFDCKKLPVDKYNSHHVDDCYSVKIVSSYNDSAVR